MRVTHELYVLCSYKSLLEHRCQDMIRGWIRRNRPDFIFIDWRNVCSVPITYVACVTLAVQGFINGMERMVIYKLFFPHAYASLLIVCNFQCVSESKNTFNIFRDFDYFSRNFHLSTCIRKQDS